MKKVFFQRACRIILGLPKHILHLVWSPFVKYRAIKTVLKVALYDFYDGVPAPLNSQLMEKVNHYNLTKKINFVIPLQCVDCIVVKRCRFTAVWVFLKHSWVMEKLLNHYVDANHSLFHRSYRNGGRSSCSLTCGNSNANSAIILVQRPCIWETHPEAFRREGLHLQPVWLFYFNTMSTVKSHVNMFREEAFQSLPARGKEMSVS